jgi:hypothetical protein
LDELHAWGKQEIQTKIRFENVTERWQMKKKHRHMLIDIINAESYLWTCFERAHLVRSEQAKASTVRLITFRNNGRFH